MSAQIQWQVISNNNAFLIRRDGVEFSRESNNLLNLNKPKFSGLINRETVGVVAGKNGKPTLVIRRRGAERKPARSTISISLNTHMRNKKNQTAHVVRQNTSRSLRRGDLTSVAIARAHAFVHANKLKPTLDKKTKRARKPRGAKARKAKKLARAAAKKAKTTTTTSS